LEHSYSQKEKIKDLGTASNSPQIVFTKEVEETVEEVSLWKPCHPSFKVFLLARLYTSNSNLSASLVIELIKNKKLPLEKTLREVHSLFASYISTVMSYQKE